MSKLRVFGTKNGQFNDKGKAFTFFDSWEVDRVAKRALKKVHGIDHCSSEGESPAAEIVVGGTVYVVVLSDEYKNQYVEAEVNEILDDGKLDVTIRETELAEKAGVNGVQIESCDRKYIKVPGEADFDPFSSLTPKLFCDGAEISDVKKLKSDSIVVVSRGERLIKKKVADSHNGQKLSVASATCKLCVSKSVCKRYRYSSQKEGLTELEPLEGAFELWLLQPEKKGEGENKLLIRLGNDHQIILEPNMPCVRPDCDSCQFILTSRKLFNFKTDENIIYCIRLGGGGGGGGGGGSNAAFNDKCLRIAESEFQEHVNLILAPDSSLEDSLALTIKALPDRIASVGDKVASAVEKGGLSAVSGIRKAASGTGKALKSGAEFLKSKIKQKEQPVTISNETKMRMKTAKVVAGGAVTVTKALMTGARTTAQMISRELASAAEKTDIGRRYANSDNKRVAAAKNLTKSAVSSAASVWEAAVDAGLSVLKDISSATGEILEHRYGADVGEVARDGEQVISSMAESARNISKVGVTAMAKTVIRGSAVEFCTDPSERKQQTPELDTNTAMTLALLSSQLPAAAAASSPAVSPPPREDGE